MKSFQTAFMFVQAALFINPCVESLALLSLWTFSSVSFNIYDVIIILFLSLVYNMLPMSICLHRYFSHQAFQTNRFGQCMLAIIGTLANQGGVLWWSSIHRKHHKYCDTKHDPHSWSQTSFIYAFLGWTCYEWRMDWDYVPNKFKKNELLVLINNSYGIIQLLLWHFIGQCRVSSKIIQEKGYMSISGSYKHQVVVRSICSSERIFSWRNAS
eukprot:182674_1